MKELPILFSAPMVRAILDGTKTQTRRQVKPQTIRKSLPHEQRPHWIDASTGKVVRCPYGQPGDQLWVRETWARDSEDGALFYRVDVGSGNEADDWQACINNGDSGYRWRPSIHMPRAASRIQLEITAVRIERLNSITISDAIAEGYDGSDPDPIDPSIKWYSALWETINGAGSWAANPHVWVVEFKRVQND